MLLHNCVIGIIYRSSSIKWYRMLSAPGAAVREDLILLRNCMSLHISTWNHLVPPLEQIPRIVSPIVATSDGCDLSSCLLACSMRMHMQQAKIKQAGEGLTEGRHASQKHDRSSVCFLLCFPSFSFLPSFYSFLPSFYPGSLLPSFLSFRCSTCCDWQKMTKHMSEPMPFAENYITKSWDPLTTRFSLRWTSNDMPQRNASLPWRRHYLLEVHLPLRCRHRPTCDHLRRSRPSALDEVQVSVPRSWSRSNYGPRTSQLRTQKTGAGGHIRHDTWEVHLGGFWFF